MESLNPGATRGEVRSLEVRFFLRHPTKGWTFSIEHLFRAIISGMPERVTSIVTTNPFPTRGVFRVFCNILAAAVRQGMINHVTGDVHYVTFLLRKRRTILTIHDAGHATRSPLRQWLFQLFWFRIPARRAAIITVDSEFSRAEVAKAARISPATLRVVPCCILPIFQRSDKHFARVRPVILQVGTAKNKNVERLAAALEGIHCHVHIVGNLLQSQREALSAFNISYSQSVNLSDEQLLQAYANCDIVAFVSVYEGFGLPIIEAQTVGRPVVAGDLASMPAVAGGAACLVNPFEIQSIREGFQRVIRDEAYRTELVEKGYVNARRYTIASVAEQFVAIYDELLRPSHAIVDQAGRH